MNYMKPLSLLAGAIALSVSCTAAIPAFAQSAPKPSPPTDQPTEQNRMPHHRNFLNLTSDQETQMQRIHENERSQIDNILTAEQKAQLETARENRGVPRRGEHRGMGRGFDSLNLTDEQRSQIESVRSTAREQMDAILTSEQRQPMQQQMQQHQEQRQEHRPGNTPQGAQPIGQ
jgi:periplasmic protein CpxP/Spy